MNTRARMLFRTAAVAATIAITSPARVAVAGGSSAGVASTRCNSCGVVESMRRIDRREDAGGMCAAADTEALPMRAIRAAGEPSRDVTPLHDTALAAIGDKPGAKKARIVTRYQIVVRFRDGTRRVFTEVTPRNLQTGDRIQVIAGAY